MATRPTPRPKRGGEEFARGHYHDAGNSSPKKPRFDIRNPSALAPDAPEEDVVLDADEIGKRGQRTKRNAVNIDGFESDSSNENFDARAEAKARDAKADAKASSKAAEQGDMFADLEEEFADGDEDEDLEREGKKKKKNVRFIDVAEIDGQIKKSRSGGHVKLDEESSSESDVADETRAELDSDLDAELGAGAKKKHAPKIDAFNLEAEKEDGGFDEQMNYVRKATDPDAVHDSWLEGLSKKDMKRAREAQEKRDKALRDKNREDDAVITADLLAALIRHLRSGETVLAALARLGPKKKKSKPKPRWQTKRKKENEDEEMQVDPAAATTSVTTEEDREEKSRAAAVEAITGAADLLMGRGQNDIYDTTREALIRSYEGETGERWSEEADAEDDDNNAADDDNAVVARQDIILPSSSSSTGEKNNGGGAMWKYRWSDARDGGDVHGPYDADTMKAWNGAGYFGEGVEFKKVDPEGRKGREEEIKEKGSSGWTTETNF